MKRPQRPQPEENGPEIEIAGIKFKGGMMVALFTIVTTLGGGAWAGFEFYKDYMDMREVVANIDVSEIRAENALVLQKQDEQMVRIEEAIEYTRDIKQGLRDDLFGIEKQVDRIEDKSRELESDIRAEIQNAEERFENKRDALQNDYDRKANQLRESNSNRMTDLENKVERDLKTLEEDLTNRLQKALDNPLAN